MIRRLFSLLILFVIGWIVYVQFWGSPDEKALRQNLFENVKETSKTVGNIIRSSKDKVKDGSFDDALNKIGDSIGSLAEEAKGMGEKYSTQIQDLNKRKTQLDNLLEKLKLKKEDETDEEAVERAERDLSQKIDKVNKSLEKLVNDMEGAPANQE